MPTQSTFSVMEQVHAAASTTPRRSTCATKTSSKDTTSSTTKRDDRDLAPCNLFCDTKEAKQVKDSSFDWTDDTEVQPRKQYCDDSGWEMIVQMGHALLSVDILAFVLITKCCSLLFQAFLIILVGGMEKMARLDDRLCRWRRNEQEHWIERVEHALAMLKQSSKLQELGKRLQRFFCTKRANLGDNMIAMYNYKTKQWEFLGDAPAADTDVASKPPPTAAELHQIRSSKKQQDALRQQSKPKNDENDALAAILTPPIHVLTESSPWNHQKAELHMSKGKIVSNVVN